MTTEGTPGFLFRNIWSSSLVMPVRETQRPSHVTENKDHGFGRRSLDLVLGTRRSTRRRKAGAGRGPRLCLDPHSAHSHRLDAS